MYNPTLAVTTLTLSRLPSNVHASMEATSENQKGQGSWEKKLPADEIAHATQHDAAQSASA